MVFAKLWQKLDGLAYSILEDIPVDRDVFA
jgi:uncharacterized protein YbaR (Trm112 family)